MRSPGKSRGRQLADQVAPPPKNARALAVTLAFSAVIGAMLWFAQPPCYELVVASSQEKFGLLDDIARKYRPDRVDRRCVTVKVIEKASGEAEAALAEGWDAADGPRPHVWSPAATTWVQLLRQHLADAKKDSLVPAAPQSLMQSPLVFGVPKKMADALIAARGRGSLGWREILALARDPAGWGALGHPELGKFALAKTNPNISTSGLHALLTTYHAATGSSDPPTPEDLQRPDVVSFVRSVEAVVVYYSDSVGAFLEALYERDQRGESLQYLHLLPMEEKQLFEYNRGNPRSLWPPKGLPKPAPLVPFYLDSTFAANHPYVVLTASWVERPHVQAAEAFFRHLIHDDQQKRFCAEGFRDHDGYACTNPADPFIDPNKPGAYLRRPDARVIVEVQRMWSRVR